MSTSLLFFVFYIFYEKKIPTMSGYFKISVEIESNLKVIINVKVY